jgi:hypothetical protein
LPDLVVELLCFIFDLYNDDGFAEE